MEIMMGQGRLAIEKIVDPESFKENTIGESSFEDNEVGPGAVVGTAQIGDQDCTIIASDAMAMNERFPVVYAGIIGLEEGYKMAMAVYKTIEADKEKKGTEKRPILLIVDTPGNGPGKQEEIFGMNKSTGAYQLALAEARKAGHPIVAMVIGRAISGAFLCHGLQADRILSLSSKFETMIHVMPLTSVSVITKLDIERLEELSKTNPVFAAGPDFFYQLGGVEELVEEVDGMRSCILKHIAEIREMKAAGEEARLGPWGRGALGEQRGGRMIRGKVMAMMDKQFFAFAEQNLY
ncbi:malonate decarboxylase gamma subunit [Malonomonas rubra DSM 5091]|uniref:Malonyl-S-ACP:biotin-protein carboxyltransferase MADD n=2 Tax=Malonomonas rubra TaxID=57040 RepID=MADD_MALRU|nr:biotin-independent malonate decarboxylase subunit gamma [Malonomonas rubra]O06927.1 RecName: Full=Malonyl-S-ACP:biotin-protein carboxyltransferase MADD [Malonomonas rubra]AAC45403.1 putative subunit of malonyl-S-acyl carrier protein: biotin carboxyltransferase [Malonomonas rubra]SHJ97835.1 malonate decarboxylase gamma subunit [Malonomonas rubra DSM 5091]